MSRRKFSPEFKRKVVEEHLKGGRSATDICRQYQLCHSVFHRWREQYEAEGPPAEASPEELARQLRQARQRVEELEGALGRTSMELDFMKRAFKRAGIPFLSGPRS